MYISEDLKEFLEHYYVLIDNNMFEGLYKKLDDEGLRNRRPELTRILFISDIDPLDYMSKVLPDMYNGITEITEIKLPDGFRSIEDRAFEGCSNLTKIVLPDSIEFISDTAFKDCFALKDIYFFGTMKQWKMLNLKDRTFLTAAATKIICKDGYIPN